MPRKIKSLEHSSGRFAIFNVFLGCFVLRFACYHCIFVFLFPFPNQYKKKQTSSANALICLCWPVFTNLTISVQIRKTKKTFPS